MFGANPSKLLIYSRNLWDNKVFVFDIFSSLFCIVMCFLDFLTYLTKAKLGYPHLESFLKCLRVLFISEEEIESEIY